ncbi:MAG: hypothetical protein MMC23_006286 [Stictis urceolatum]|nr:hypothetical protein [Stictis urceolata]
MALLYLKNLIHPSREYRRLIDPGSYDLEETFDLASAGPSTPSRSSISDEHDEKAYHDGSPTPSPSPSQSQSLFDARLISAATIGFSDGLTVPFALTAGLSAIGTSRVVIYGGLSELIAGTISMGMGGFLGAKGEAAAYTATLARTHTTVHTSPHQTTALLTQTLSPSLPPGLLSPLITHLLSHPPSCISFLMAFHHHMPPSSFSPRRAYIHGAVIASGYVVGGIVPLLPYMVVHDVHRAFRFSIVFTGVVLFLFGWVKTRVVGERSVLGCSRGAVEMLLLGGFAAGAAVGCVRLLKT